MASDIEIRGATQFRELATKFKAIGDEGRLLANGLRGSVREAVKPMQRAAQENARAIPVKGGMQTGLRGNIANAVKVKTAMTPRQAAVRMQVDPKAMPSGQAKLPYYMEGVKPWRHPVYGTSTWVTQPSHPYFQPAVDAHLVEARKTIDEAVTKITRAL